MSDYINYSLTNNPIESFTNWYQDAKKVEDNAEAMTLSTIFADQKRPDSRTVLLKGISDKGISFYTNYESKKGQELDKNNEACILFYWHKSKRQVRVQGRVVKMSEDESRSYFSSRDRQSQLASYMSHQSHPIEDKNALLQKLENLKVEFENKEIPLPKTWGGYFFIPYEFEFFVYGDYRINDRFLYELKDGQWSITRLQP